MCLRFVFLLTTQVTTWLRLSRRAEAWKTAEILILRHQLAVLQRRQTRRPKLNWAERALLAALLGVLPKARRQGLRRDIVRRRWGALPITKALLGRATWPNSTRMLITEPSQGRILPLGMPLTGRLLIGSAFELSA